MENKVYHSPSKTNSRYSPSSNRSLADKNQQGTESGFSHLELILWISALTSLFITFISLNRYTEQKHEQILTEFVTEWNSIN